MSTNVHKFMTRLIYYNIFDIIKYKFCLMKIFVEKIIRKTTLIHIYVLRNLISIFLYLYFFIFISSLYLYLYFLPYIYTFKKCENE